MLKMLLYSFTDNTGHDTDVIPATPYLIPADDLHNLSLSSTTHRKTYLTPLIITFFNYLRS